jgi:hypothetical protein
VNNHAQYVFNGFKLDCALSYVAQLSTAPDKQLSNSKLFVTSGAEAYEIEKAFGKLIGARQSRR